MSPRSSHSATEREKQRARWAGFVLGHWKQLAYPHVLSKRETSVLSLRLGLTGAPISQRQIAARLDLSTSTVSHLEVAARRKVAAALTHGKERPYETA